MTKHRKSLLVGAATMAATLFSLLSPTLYATTTNFGPLVANTTNALRLTEPLINFADYAPPAPEPTPTAAPTPAPPLGPPSLPAVDCNVTACVALTFDDGPNQNTVAVLDALASRHAPATFFVLGLNVAKHPEIVVRAAAAGHEIGNHTWGHRNLAQTPEPEFSAQVDQGATIIQQTIHRGPVLFRPPYGSTNDQVNGALGARGYGVVMWSIDTEDWKNRDTATTAARALTGVAPGSIILMHDIYPSTAAAIPGVVDSLRASGFTLVTVSQLLGPDTAGHVYRHR